MHIIYKLILIVVHLMQYHPNTVFTYIHTHTYTQTLTNKRIHLHKIIIIELNKRRHYHNLLDILSYLYIPKVYDSSICVHKFNHHPQAAVAAGTQKLYDDTP